MFCEKTMAPTVPDCWAMVRACELAKVKLMVGHKRRLRPPWARIIQLHELLGAPIAMSIVGYFDSRPDNFQGWWTREGKAERTHAFGSPRTDWMRAVCGDVRRIGNRRPQVDCGMTSRPIHVMLRFRSGAIHSWASRFPILAALPASVWRGNHLPTRRHASGLLLSRG